MLRLLSGNLKSGHAERLTSVSICSTDRLINVNDSLNCNWIHFWSQGQCTPRLCGKERVFNGDDGLCHDIYDALECKGGRRFYYTAFGDPICDCPIGQFPFPGPSDDCVPLFTRGKFLKRNLRACAWFMRVTVRYLAKWNGSFVII